MSDPIGNAPLLGRRCLFCRQIGGIGIIGHFRIYLGSIRTRSIGRTGRASVYVLRLTEIFRLDVQKTIEKCLCSCEHLPDLVVENVGIAAVFLVAGHSHGIKTLVSRHIKGSVEMILLCDDDGGICTIYPLGSDHAVICGKAVSIGENGTFRYIPIKAIFFHGLYFII